MPFIPNSGDTSYPDIAEPDAQDFEILLRGIAGTGVVSGCVVTAGTGLNVAVSSGTATLAGATVTVAGGTVGPLGAASTTLGRFDLIYATSAGAVTSLAGTASTNPVFPTVPANVIPLAVVYLPASSPAVTQVTAAMINQKSVPGNLGRGTFTDSAQILSSSAASTPQVITKPATNDLYLKSASGSPGGAVWAALPSSSTPAVQVAGQATLAATTSAIVVTMPTSSRPLHITLRFALRTVTTAGVSAPNADVYVTPVFASGAALIGTLTSSLAVTTSPTTIQVVEAVGATAPATNSYVIVNDEVMQVTSRTLVSGTTYNYGVTRNVLNTTPKITHAIGSAVVSFPQAASITGGVHSTAVVYDRSTTSQSTTPGLGTVLQGTPGILLSMGRTIVTSQVQHAGVAELSFVSSSTPYALQARSEFTAFTPNATLIPTSQRKGEAWATFINTASATTALAPSLVSLVINAASTVTATGTGVAFGAGSSYVVEYATAPTA